MGRDYDAVLLSTGHLGFAMGSTATAMVNVQAVADRHGHSPLAFLLIPVMGAFLIDIANALIDPGFPGAAMVHLVTRALLLLLALALAGCARGPAATEVRDALQRQLDDALGGRVVAIESLQRAGGAPGGDGAARLVYYNASLKLARDYDFTQWDGHTVTSLANLLGAGPKGVFGIKPEGNKAGDVLGVYGSAAFAESGGRYTLVAVAPAAAAEVPVPAAAAAVRGAAPGARGRAGDRRGGRARATGRTVLGTHAAAAFRKRAGVDPARGIRARVRAGARATRPGGTGRGPRERPGAEAPTPSSRRPWKRAPRRPRCRSKPSAPTAASATSAC